MVLDVQFYGIISIERRSLLNRFEQESRSERDLLQF